MTLKKDLFERIIHEIKTNFKHDVALLCHYGSTLDGTDHEKSDIDMYFVPKTDKGYGLMHQFIIDGIGYDLYPISWDRLQAMANYDDAMASLIMDAEVIYHDSEEDLHHFLALKEQLTRYFLPASRHIMLEKAAKCINNCYCYLHNIYVAEEICEARFEASQLIDHALLTLAYINQSYFHKGLGKNLKELKAFTLIPYQFEQHLESIITARKLLSLKTSSLLLLTSLESLLKQEQGTNGNMGHQHYHGFYEEILSSFNKLDHACHLERFDEAFFAAFNIQKEIAAFINFEREGYWPMKHQQYRMYKTHYEEAGFIDLLCLANPDNLLALKEGAESLRVQLLNYLRDNKVSIVHYQSVNDVFTKKRT